MYSSKSHDTFVICDELWNVEYGRGRGGEVWEGKGRRSVEGEGKEKCGRGRGGEVWEGNTQSQMVNVSCDVLLGIGLDLPHPPI